MDINESLTYTSLTNMKVAKAIHHIVFPKNTDEIIAAYKLAKKKNLQPFPLGGGSNTLIGDAKNTLFISDRHLAGLKCKIRQHSANGVKITEDGLIIASSNQNINNLIFKLANLGFGGLEFLAGIPAHLGGMIFMNAGAYGYCISQFIEWIEVCDEKGEKIIPKEQLMVDYRSTNVKGFITKACLRLNKISDTEQYLKIVNDAIALRAEKHPMDMPSLGCFFKNPKGILSVESGVLSKDAMLRNGKLKTQDSKLNSTLNTPQPTLTAGQLIDQAGLKGFSVGGAMVSPKHANFIVNTGNATFDDIITLKDIVKDKVYKKFNIKLEEEVRIINV